MAPLLPSTQDIAATAIEELAFLGGTVADKCDDGKSLFLRAFLPRSDEVRPRDIVEGGIALRTVGQEIVVCPYLFRQVCRNGAIMPQVVEIQHIQRVEFDAPSEAIEAVNEELREAVHACSAAEVFTRATQQVRSSLTTEVPSDIFNLLLWSSYRRTIPTDLVRQIMQAFREAEDRSAFSLMNAVTSVARDQEDPEDRWELEELGGGVPAMKFPQVRPDGSAAELALSEV